MQWIKTRPAGVYISVMVYSWALKLSGSSWQTSTGSVFHRQTALGEKVWLYVLILHWICLYLVLDPLVRMAAGWRWAEARMATRSFRMRYSNWTLLRARRCWRESHWSFCSMAVTLDVGLRLKYRQVNRAAFLCTASILVTLCLTGLSHTDEAYSSWGLTKV